MNSFDLHGIYENGTDETVCKAEGETRSREQMYGH